jgi:hypothetical protein
MRGLPDAVIIFQTQNTKLALQRGEALDLRVQALKGEENEKDRDQVAKS